MSDNEKTTSDLLGESKPAKNSAKATIGVDEIAALVKAAVEAATSKQAEMFSQILMEAKKPYRDPKQAVNDETFRAQSREIEERIRENLKAAQSSCPHKQGCNPLSEYQSQLSSFVMHRLDTGLVWGICTYCQKQIYSDRESDRRFFAEKSANRMSSAGQRTFLDPGKAMRKGHPIGYEEDPTPAAVAQR